MTYRSVGPEPGELFCLNVDSPFLLAGQIAIESTNVTFHAGQLPTGAASFSVNFGDTDYGKEVSAAVVEALDTVNSRWGLTDDWSPKTHRFTGMANKPFAPRDPA